MTQKPPNRMRGLLWLVAASLAVAGIYLVWTSQQTSGATVRSSAADHVTRRAENDLERYIEADYAAVYAHLSELDRQQVTRDEWIARCEEVEAVAGMLEKYQINALSYMDPDESIVEVSITAWWTNVPGPQVTSAYYVLEDGSFVQTMLWGREFVLSSEPLR